MSELREAELLRRLAEHRRKVEADIKESQLALQEACELKARILAKILAEFEQ